MSETTQALVEWVGRKSNDGSQHVTEDQASRLEERVREYNEVGLANLRIPARAAIVGGCVLAACLLIVIGWAKLSFGIFWLVVAAGLATFVTAGLFASSPLFLQLRDYLLGFRWMTYLKLAVGALLFLAVLALFNLLLIWLLAIVMGAVIGAGLYFALDRHVERQRRPAVDECQELLKQLRLRGLDEEQLRHFVCKYAGNNWEEIFEELFGYEEKLKARDWWVRVQKGQARPKYAGWREPVIAAITARLAERHEEAERRKLRELERDRLIAGVAPIAADAPISRESEVPQAEKVEAIRVVSGQDEPRRPRPIAPIVFRDAPDDKPVVPPPSPTRIASIIVNLALGPTVRLLVGTVLLVGFLGWMYQNGLIHMAKEVQTIEQAAQVLQAEEANALSVSILPDYLTRWFTGYGAAVAGMLLIASGLLPNWKAGLFMPLAAVIAMLGPRLGVPEVPPLTAAQLSMAIGGVVGLLGILAGRRP